MPYSTKFREKMLAKLTGPGRRTATSLAKEVGVPQATLSRWLREAKVEGMTQGESKKGAGRGRTESRRKRWTPAEKIRVVREATAAGEAGLGALLRREGLHEADLERFREEVLDAAAKGFEAGRPRRGLSPEQKQVRRLKKELKRKEKALAETAALLVLRKKAEAFFLSEEEGDDTDGSSE